MKKIYGILVIGIFLLSTFLAINLYNSASFPGYGQNETCNNCHNQPAFVRDVTASFAMNNFTQANQVFSQYGKWATDEVPVIQTNNRSLSNLEFVRMSFLKNSTSIMVMAQVNDATSTAKGTGSATSDKFGIIFNIDVANFTVGDFLTYYNSSTNNLDNVLQGQMAFPNGHADLWYVDVGVLGTNTTGMASDRSISSGILTDIHQYVHVGIYYGNFDHGHGYQFFFVRDLITNDSNDAQFNNNGVGINYAIASWDDSETTSHHSSFDQMVIVGDSIGVQSTLISNFTTTYSEPASITSSLTAFTVVMVLALVAIAIPIVFYFKPKK